MKYFSFAILISLATNLTAQQAPAVKSQLDSASYAFGMVMAQNLKRQITFDLNYDIFAHALGQALAGKTTPLFTAETASSYFQTFSTEQTFKAGEVARVAGEKFLEANKARKGVMVTPSGLQYEIIKKGTAGGEKPLATTQVKVHYHGTLIDGSVFDSSVERGQPATFGLNQVISGWTEGLQLMQVGDKFKFFLPYKLAYGERAAGAKIKPFSALVFEVELLEIVK